MSLSRFTLVISLALASHSADFSAAPLTLDQALQQAVQSYPALAAQQARVDAARQARIPADQLPDPKLGIGIDNFPISGPMANSLTADFMTMQRISVMQEVPNADKRRARRDSAEARVAQASADGAETDEAASDGPVASAQDAPPAAPTAAEPEPAPEPPAAPEADANSRDEPEQETRQFTALEADEAQRPPPATGKPEPQEDEVHDELEETPDFLQETPDHDRLWFEQKPPRDFDF